MILKLTLGTGEELDVQFDRSSALTVTNVVNVDGVQTEKAEAHADIVAIELVEGDVVPTPKLVQMTGEQAAAQDVQVPISETVGQPTPPDEPVPVDGATVGAGPSDLEGGDPGDVGAQGTPNPVVGAAEGTTNDAGLGDTTGGTATTETPAATDTTTQPLAGDASLHDQAVANAQAAVDAAASGAPDEHVRQAIADVDAALAVYPDSLELQDAKAQLGMFVSPGQA